MTDQALILLSLGLPFGAALVIPFFSNRPNDREGVTLLAALSLFAVVVTLLTRVLAGAQPGLASFEVGLGLELALQIEPLGMMFATVAATLWIVNSIYSVGYMRGNKEVRQTQFYVCFAIAIGSTMAIAFAGNLFTLFLAYEALTLSTYPLVTHKADENARRGGRIYLLLLLSTSMIGFLPAIIWTWFLANTVTFTPGGILPASTAPLALGLLLALYVFGIGKAALMPFHFWLPAAMVAPTPVSALLHAVAVVKAGVFSVVKIVVYVFGIDLLSTTGASDWLVFVASFSVLMASLVALSKDNLKARLAYSTVSQLAYVVLGASLATSAAIVGSGMHIAMHAAGKITLFFCAGAIYVAAHKTEISDMRGIGRAMPITMTAFLIGSLSVIGLPPLGGTWSKWWLAVGAADAGHLFVIAVLMISSLLNVAYLIPIVARGFFLPPAGQSEGARVAINEAPLACTIPIAISALLCVVLFFLAGHIEDFLARIVASGGLTRGGLQ